MMIGNNFESMSTVNECVLNAQQTEEMSKEIAPLMELHTSILAKDAAHSSRAKI